MMCIYLYTAYFNGLNSSFKYICHIFDIYICDLWSIHQ